MRPSRTGLLFGLLLTLGCATAFARRTGVTRLPGVIDATIKAYQAERALRVEVKTPQGTHRAVLSDDPAVIAPSITFDPAPQTL